MYNSPKGVERTVFLLNRLWKFTAPKKRDLKSCYNIYACGCFKWLEITIAEK
jgi:hypothetical protein